MGREVGLPVSLGVMECAGNPRVEEVERDTSWGSQAIQPNLIGEFQTQK